MEGGAMEAIRLFEKETELSWEYDGEADVLYISLGKPKEAVGIDIGDGVIVRYNEGEGEVVGLTILGLRGRLERFLRERSEKQGKA
jgi:uncharacterized protein YuzE